MRLVRVAVPAMFLVGCATTGSDTVEVDAPPPDTADRETCAALLEELPGRVADQESRVVEPSTEWTAAWGDPAIVLTCGVPPPAGFRRTSTCTTVNGIDWFIPEEQLESDEPADLTMTTVNREPFVEVVLPAEHGPPATALADLSSAVRTVTDRTGSCV